MGLEKVCMGKWNGKNKKGSKQPQQGGRSKKKD
jgi:hypothetical protein